MLRIWGHEVWSLPAGACLATRIPCGEEITGRKLEVVRACEDYLHKRGLRQVRVRLDRGEARVSTDADGLEALAAMSGRAAEDSQHRCRRARSACGDERTGRGGYSATARGPPPRRDCRSPACQGGHPRLRTRPALSPWRDEPADERLIRSIQRTGSAIPARQDGALPYLHGETSRQTSA